MDIYQVNGTKTVWYDNDSTNDYVDWYLMALASTGAINYRGISTSCTVAPFNRHVTADRLQKKIALRSDMVQWGRECGLKNIPAPVDGTRTHLVPPETKKIEDTAPLGSPGTRALIEAARERTPEDPLIVCMAGPLTLAADAWLSDREAVEDNIIVAWTGGNYDHTGDYNGWIDPWSAYIALQKLRVFLFPVSRPLLPRLSKEWIINNMPDNKVREYMYTADLDIVNNEDGDVDGMPAVPLTRDDYVLETRPVACGGWIEQEGHELPVYKHEEGSRAILITKADAEAASKEYERAFTVPGLWSE